MQRARGTSRAHPSAGSFRCSSSTDAVTAVARPLALDRDSDSDFHFSNTDGHTSDGMESVVHEADEQRYANVAAQNHGIVQSFVVPADRLSKASSGTGTAVFAYRPAC